ncbi:unnamed protein product [Trichogramma brassicae]|uniref:XPG-I domain-containing protein n=1 Tax=Trichogramma brassicae TaxID=86971 RepID=A0A6H5I6I3_9HYME|nr:unnamed protein product [Trichogramma brassicae]
MGVKDLWNILSPISERKPLFELQGKAIAIDLSCWVVDSQTVTDNHAQPKMYLRNLFFRTSYFLLHDIFPVFVLEGTAPTLKHKTIAKRNEERNGGEEKKKGQKGGRTRFNHVLKECEEMLKYMGLVCVKGFGEAEAMCAYLNADGLVDACISQDSDCFLYGAKVVYRNFCTSTQGNRTTSGGSIDEYSMEKIQSVFNLGRNKMIALALLLGCDYDDGLPGVGKEAALKLFKIVDDCNILQRIKEWKTNSTKYQKMEAELSNPEICTNCGHKGKVRSHTKFGCEDCGTTTKCNDSYKEKRLLISNELSMRKKALLVDNFPNQELIDEFLIRTGSVPSKLDFKWSKPMIVKFIDFMDRKVAWEPSYAFAKIFPLATRWQLVNLIEYPIQQRLNISGVFFPEKIKKIRNIRSVASYEILWFDKDKLLDGLYLNAPNSNDDLSEEENSDKLTELVTIEPQDIVNKCYPNIVQEFEAERNAKKKKPARTRKKKDDENVDDNVEKRPVRRKRVNNATEIKNNRKIVDFIQKVPTAIEKPLPALEEAFDRLSITPKRMKKNTPKKRGPQFERVMATEKLDSILNGSLEMMFNELTPEDFASDLDVSLDMSLVIDNIVGATNSEKVENVSDKENLANELGVKKPRNRKSSNIILDEHEVTDEFDAFNKSYVPLDKRIGNEKNFTNKPNESLMSIDTNVLNRMSMGIESLLDATDD